MPNTPFSRARRGAVASMQALAVALTLAGGATPALAQTGTGDQTGTAGQTDPQSGPTTNVPSTADPAATQTPGGSTEQPTETVGTPGAGAGEATVGTDQAGQDIVVTGFRASIANAIAEKRQADQIVESVSAEEIGKLPDTSIAESIARLPGLTAQRVDGRDQVISIRGLSPDFTATLLNGREQVTTGDNRAVEFDQYPAELIGQVVVYKTPTSGLVGQGLAGTVDLRTIRPLEYGKQVFAANVRGEDVQFGKLNAGTRDKGFRASGTYVGQFAHDTLGVTLGVAHTESPTQYKNYNAWGYATFSCGNNPAYHDAAGACLPAYAAADGKFILGGAKPFVQSEELNRTGVVGTVEWKPSDSFTSTLDAYYSKFKDRQILRGIELPLYYGQGGTNAVTLQPGYTVVGNTITAGIWNNVKGVVRNDENTRNDDLLSLGYNGKYTTGRWTLDGDVSYSGVKRRDRYIETYSGTSRFNTNGPYDTLGFQLHDTGVTTFNSTLNYADPNLVKLTDPQGWGAATSGQEGYDNEPATKDHLYAFRGSVSRELDGGIKSVELGANYTMRHKSYSPDEYLLQLKDYEADPTRTTGVPIPDDDYEGTTKLSYLGIAGMVSADPLGLLQSGVYDLARNPSTDVTLKGWTLDEDVLTGWLRSNIDTEVGSSGTLTGNLGVQVVYTDQSSDGVLGISGGTTTNAAAISDGRKYTEVLPSMNLSMRFNNSNVLRIGVARELARARMDQLKASFNYGFTIANLGEFNPSTGTSFFNGGGGNPRLKPWIADAADLSYEHYFGRQGYLAVAGYYKYLETYIYNETTLQDFSGLNVALPTGTVLGANDQFGFVSVPQNGTGGELYGVEVSGSFPLAMLTKHLDGFGVLGSYSHTESSIVSNPAAPATPLPGLSKNVWDVTGYFEKWGFSARVSARYRSKFLAQVVGFGVSPINQIANSETILDAQVGYDIKSGFLKGLGILVQGSNLTNEPFSTYNQGSPNQVLIYQAYGRRYLAGLSYKF